jgi:transcriptional antiterminator NusG
MNQESMSSPASADFKWYVVHVLSGFEHRVLKSLKDRIVTHKMENSFGEILLPEETVVANVKGKKRNMKKKFFPGYLLINMVMNDKTWHLVKSTDKITSFVSGDRMKPTPISEEEARQLTNQVAEGFKKPKSTAIFSEGDNVKVLEGPFATFVGVVEAVNERGKVKVQVSIFGRPTPVELDTTQIEKV